MTTRTVLWMSTVICLAVGAGENAQAQWWNPLAGFAPNYGYSNYGYSNNGYSNGYSSCPGGNCSATRYAPQAYPTSTYRPYVGNYSTYGNLSSTGSCANGQCGVGTNCANGRCGTGCANGQCGTGCANGQCGTGMTCVNGQCYRNNSVNGTTTNYRTNYQTFPSTGFSNGSRVQYLPPAPMGSSNRHTNQRSPFFD